MKYFRSVGSSFVLTNHDEGSWLFTVVSGSQTGQGLLQYDDIKQSASDVNQSVEEYSQIMKLIFSGQTEECSLELKMEDNKPKELSWKKVTASGVKFALGTVILKIPKTDNIGDVLSEIAALIADLNQNLLTCKQKLDDTKAFSDELVKKLQSLSDMKTQLESELFTKFVLVLNEKKDKIRSLKQEIGMLKKEAPSTLEDGANVVHISADEKRVKSDSPSSKSSQFEEGEVDASFISKLHKRVCKVKPSSRSKRSRPRPNYKVPSDDEAVDADELVNDL